MKKKPMTPTASALFTLADEIEELLEPKTLIKAIRKSAKGMAENETYSEWEYEPGGGGEIGRLGSDSNNYESCESFNLSEVISRFVEIYSSSAGGQQLIKRAVGDFEKHLATLKKSIKKT